MRELLRAIMFELLVQFYLNDGKEKRRVLRKLLVNDSFILSTETEWTYSYCVITCNHKNILLSKIKLQLVFMYHLLLFKKGSELHTYHHFLYKYIVWLFCYTLKAIFIELRIFSFSLGVWKLKSLMLTSSI